ncbi:rhomboid family intramembrane serine protease [Candidatus Parvarchaeota archaeon]|nr:rhomboid family intramembrane serine protease [Candidatus Parvarchaeota archaeon]
MLKEEFSSNKGMLRQLVKDYKWLIIAGLVLFLPSIMIYAAKPTILPYCPVKELCSAYSTPWGAFTSIFIYDSWTNIFAFAVFFVFLWAMEIFARDYVRPRRANFTAIFMYVAGISANLIDIAYKHNVISFGPSGVVYAFIGIVVSLSLINILLPNWERGKNDITKIEDKTYVIINLIVFVFFFLWIFFYPASFISKSQGVNYAVHGIAFLIGFVGTFARAVVLRIKHMPQPKYVLEK